MTTGERGFTLIEVLVALLVLALGMIAVYNALGQSARNANSAREQIYGNWIAMNLMTELRLGGEWPSLGTRQGDVEFANEVWEWELDVEETPNETIRRLTVSVNLPDREGEPIVERTGFMRRPSEFPSGARVPWTGQAVPGDDVRPGTPRVRTGREGGGDDG